MGKINYVLMLEDDEAVGSTMQMVLDHEDIVTRWAKTTVGARKLLDEQIPKTILLDYILEGESPADLKTFVDYVRTKTDCPIVLVTAANVPEAIAETLHISDMLKKPFTLEDLTDMVKRYATGEYKRASSGNA